MTPNGSRPPNPVPAAAGEACAAGLCVVPPREDGTKMPVDTWKQYQRERPGAARHRTWFTDRCRGLGIVTGAVSGNVELFEFDDRATFARFLDAAAAAGLGELVARIRAGYESETPGDGIHWLTRCAEIAGNTTLASRPLPEGKKQALIQTRGEGGYAVEAPSHGGVHPTGKPYRLVSGSFATIADLTPDERRALWQLARTFDELPRPRADEPAPRPASSMNEDAGDRPGDRFNAEARWADILEPHGWALVFRRGEVGYWRRPGKREGVSATTDHDGHGYLYVFSTSTAFDDQRGYSKFAAYATLAHAGDFAAAARALRAQGYGAASHACETGTDVPRTHAAGDDPDASCAARLLAENAALRAENAALKTENAALRADRRRADEEAERAILRTTELEVAVRAHEAAARHPDQTIGGSSFDLAEALAGPDFSGDTLVQDGETFRLLPKVKAARRRSPATLTRAVVRLEQAGTIRTITRTVEIQTPEYKGPTELTYIHAPGMEHKSPAELVLDLLPTPGRKRHGGRKQIAVPAAVAGQEHPVKRERELVESFFSLVDGALIGKPKTRARRVDFWTKSGEELTADEAARIQLESGMAPDPPARRRGHLPAYVPTVPARVQLERREPSLLSVQVDHQGGDAAQAALPLDIPGQCQDADCTRKAVRAGYCETHYAEQLERHQPAWGYAAAGG